MVNEQVLGAMSGFMLKQWWDSLTATKCGCCHLEYAVDDNDRQVYSVCMGWHDADDRPVIAWKIGRQSSISAMQCDFDFDFEMPYDPESGEVDDTLVTIETEPADWNEIVKDIRAAARRIAKTWVDKGAKKDKDDKGEIGDETDKADEGELVFTDDLGALNETSLRYQWLWVRDRPDGCGNIEFARSECHRYCVCLGYHDKDGKRKLAWKIGRIRVDEQKKFGFDTGYKTVNDSLVVLDDGFSDWDSLADEMKEAVARFRKSRESTKEDR